MHRAERCPGVLCPSPLLFLGTRMSVRLPVQPPFPFKPSETKNRTEQTQNHWGPEQPARPPASARPEHTQPRTGSQRQTPLCSGACWTGDENRPNPREWRDVGAAAGPPVRKLLFPTLSD